MAHHSISEAEVQRVAALARLSLSAERVSALQRELTAILEYVGLLDELDTDGVEVMAHPVCPHTPLREDRVVPGCDREEALSQAPASRDGGFSVPKVLEVDP